MITCMETIFPSPCAELNYDTATLRTERNPKYQLCIQQLMQKPQFIAPDTRKVCVRKIGNENRLTDRER